MGLLGVIVSCAVLAGGAHGDCQDVFHASQAEATKLACSKRLRDEAWRQHLIATPDHALEYQCREVSQ